LAALFCVTASMRAIARPICSTPRACSTLADVGDGCLHHLRAAAPLRARERTSSVTTLNPAPLRRPGK
jgi:hypothetical protein